MKAKDLASKRFWRNMPVSSTINFLLAVFFIFAPIGFIIDILNGGKLSIERVWLSVLYSGLVSIGYAFSFTRNFWVLPFTIIFQFGFHFIPWARIFPGVPGNAVQIQDRMIFDALGIMVCIILAYIILIRFITREGIKHISLTREMELAGEIHRVLVPDIDINDSRFEITGRSNPTYEVGGDLIDMIRTDDEMITYMIDVSGHGVGPGLLTGMFKASFRSIYKEGKSLKEIVNNLNNVLLDQRKKGLFITFCGLRFYRDGQIELLSAGHPPVIRINDHDAIEELKFDTQLPLLTLRNSEYNSNTIEARPGELFVIYSDGMTETTNKKGDEFGYERLKEVLQNAFTLPTSKISQKVYSLLNKHGISKDDQSLIVIRNK